MLWELGWRWDGWVCYGVKVGRGGVKEGCCGSWGRGGMDGCDSGVVVGRGGVKVGRGCD